MILALAQVRATPDRERNVERAIETISTAGQKGADLVVFPELAVDRFFPRHPDADVDSIAEPIPGPTTERVARAARDAETAVVFNCYEEDERGRRYDASPVFDAEGDLLGVTRMVHVTDFENFHERAYYDPGDRGAPVYETAACRVGVAICYDRHYPEYMRALGVGGADLVTIPQAGLVDEWPGDLLEAEVRTAAFQNGYFGALCNRVGTEGDVTFSGESFVSDPEGNVIARGAAGEEDLVIADIDPDRCSDSTARTLFWRDRRPELYDEWLS
jgi:N-carbamoylputrescine amidase